MSCRERVARAFYSLLIVQVLCSCSAVVVVRHLHQARAEGLSARPLLVVLGCVVGPVVVGVLSYAVKLVLAVEVVPEQLSAAERVGVWAHACVMCAFALLAAGFAFGASVGVWYDSGSPRGPAGVVVLGLLVGSCVAMGGFAARELAAAWRVRSADGSVVQVPSAVR